VFGIGPEKLPGLIDWATAALESGILGWPGLFMSVADARAFVHDCLPSVDGLALLGIGLHIDDRDTFLLEGIPEGPVARAWGHTGSDTVPAVYTRVREGRQLAPDGMSVGFELLGYDGLGGFHSWLCNSLEQLVYSNLQIRPNEAGFLNSFDEAQQALAVVSRNDVGKEPGVWLPWLVQRYDMK
jgi:hypothetical protein